MRTKTFSYEGVEISFEAKPASCMPPPILSPFIKAVHVLLQQEARELQVG